MYKVIFLDDEAITLQLLERAIDWRKYSLTLCGTATDGVEGIELFRQVQPDIVVTDIRMPNMDGIAFTRAIRQSKKKVKILLLSAYAEFEYAQNAITYQISDYLLKPLDEDKFADAIGRIVQELDHEHALSSTVENYRVEQAERTLLQFFTIQRERFPPGPDNTLPAEVRETLRSADTVLHIIRTTDPHQLQVPPDIDELRLFFKGRLGSETAVIPISSVELVALTIRSGLLNRLEGILTELHGRNQPLQIGLSFMDATFNLAQAARQAESAVHSCFYSGEKICTFTGQTGFSHETGIKFTDFEHSVMEFVEQGKADDFRETLQSHLKELFQRRVEPFLISAFVFDIMNWVKLDMTKHYGPTKLAELEILNRERLWACGSRESLLACLDFYIQMLRGLVLQLLLDESGLYIVKSAKDYTRKHYTEVGFTLQDVAEFIGLSKNHFSSIFHKTTGQKFWDYVTQLRIEKAKELLKQSNWSNYEICSAIGYASEFYFSKIFKKVVGMSAQQYRRM
jgi:two-component system response regulator YesN